VCITHTGLTAAVSDQFVNQRQDRATLRTCVDPGYTIPPIFLASSGVMHMPARCRRGGVRRRVAVSLNVNKRHVVRLKLVGSAYAVMLLRQSRYLLLPAAGCCSGS